MNNNHPLNRLRHHVSGAIARGEAVAIVEQRNAPHIAEQVTALLVADGWNNQTHSLIFKKINPTGGQFGYTTQTLRIDSSGRWLERVDGWGTVERDVDLREYTGNGTDLSDNPEGAIKDVLK